MIFAIDFDGTLVDKSSDYPEVGPDLGGLFWLWQLKFAGASLIAWTCREGEALDLARTWLNEHCPGLFDAVNAPAPDFPFNSRKVFADVYVDDRALGAPTRRRDPCSDERVFDWGRAGPALLRIMGIQ